MMGLLPVGLASKLMNGATLVAYSNLEGTTGEANYINDVLESAGRYFQNSANGIGFILGVFLMIFAIWKIFQAVASKQGRAQNALLALGGFLVGGFLMSSVYTRIQNAGERLGGEAEDWFDH